MLNFKIDKSKYKHIHFIGIGGISMSALAQISIKEGFFVSGSDSKESQITKKLEYLGIKVYIGHSRSNVKNADLVVFTDAISIDNEELNAAISEKIDIIDRASFLGAIMKNYKQSIAVSGTHGKTSTTSMIANILVSNKIDATIMVGGNLDIINGNIKIGQSDLFLTEACEYKANILKYYPTTAVILNIDEDHLDYFDNMNHIIETFKNYTSNLTKNDKLIINIDDENARLLINNKNSEVITFSTKENADYMAKNIEYKDNGFTKYDLYYKNKFIDRVNLSVMGTHNISNSLAAIAATHENLVDFKQSISGIESYVGVHRRLEDKGEYGGAFIKDDYAHHPTEIKASLEALKKACKGKLYCVFQPHTFTRTKILLDSFSKSFNDADVIIITDIYAAREKDYGDIHSKVLCEAIKKNGSNAFYISNFEDIVKYLKENLSTNDIIVTMGAGDVYKIGEMLLK